MLVTIYVYRVSDGCFIYEHMGLPEYAMQDLGEDKDFTMVSPPDSDHQWLWVVDKWEAKPERIEPEDSNEPAE